ncbi:PHP domain-containing protein [Acinetobacter sp. CAAS 2-6]|uniref:PHP domain-containing protein n=1 Tax=Acinetobacter sp. CAAS 2-6 TaxID=3016358 RepID=UPI002DD63ECD|nr:PHP domain-containing protein [Acinetobacter sp. CAAS 2-6]
MQGVDLHTHSNISDGTLSPAALVESAVAHGIHTLALTDHDSMDGVLLAQQAAQSQPLDIITGVEISSQWSRPATQKSYGVHIVALNMQNPEPLYDALAKQKQIRAQRAEQICALLQPLIGRQIYDEVLALADFQADHITRTHIAKVLVNQQIVSRPQQAFDRFLKEGKKAFVRFDGLSLPETVQVIQQSRGFAVLAHPTRYDLSATNVRYLIELFAQAGGHAVELPPGIDPLSTRQMIDRMIAQYQLKVSVGSDFHGENMPWIRLGHIPKVNPEQYGIWQDFQ